VAVSILPELDVFVFVWICEPKEPVEIGLEVDVAEAGDAEEVETGIVVTPGPALAA